MRTLLKISMPVEQGNRGIRDGSLPKTLQSVADTLKPEATYYYAEKGRRTALMVFDLKEPSQIPSVTEPLFMNLNAEVELYPAMNAEDLKTGLAKAAQNRERIPVAA